jgi:glutathione S-transferase
MRLYYAPMSRAITAYWMLEELGVAYELEVLNLKQNDNMKPEYLKINPMGKVPALEHRGEVINEAAAICAYLADEFGKLNVPVGQKGRANYLRWLFYAPSCMEPAVVDVMFKRGEAPPGSLGYGTMERMLNMVTLQLEKTPYFAGDEFTAADVVAGGTLIWGQMVGVLPKEPFQAYVERIQKRPAFIASFQKSTELATSMGLVEPAR